MPRKKIKADSVIENKESGVDSIDATLEGKKDVPADKISNVFNSEGELVVDVFETNSDFVVLTAIAGVLISDIDIAVEKDMMIIKGKRTNPNDHPEKKYFYQECYWGPFSKKIVLPENIDTSSTEAQINKGILTIKIPKIGTDNKSVKEKTENVELS